jgi:hypothetical protein
MLPYQRINNFSGWFIFAVATIVYWITVEPTASYWDCGEFIAVSYKLQVPHPPGAPLFLLIGRMFSFLAMGDVERVAYWVNIVSVLSSSFTILFLFWTLTLLGRKLLNIVPENADPAQILTLMGGAGIGALAYTFSDSFWFSAEEAEVYGMSSFFTAFVFWAILKWELVEDESTANKWLILIAYMMGLSIGVHLLNLVTIPALAFIYYFKKYRVTRWGIIATLLISGVLILFINDFIIPGLPSLAGSLEVFFVNSLGMPFGSGVIVFGAALIGSLVYGIFITQQRGLALLNTALLSLAFILIGYSSYTSMVIRSNYNPPIDENNPENIISFVSYLKREQYGSRPLLRGQYFDAEIVDQKQGAPVYTKGEDRYEITDYKLSYVYDPARITILPRAYSSDPRHINLYREWMGLKENEKPNFIDNISFMLRYQIGHMYMRYFMWNFAGRESDIQHADWVSPLHLTRDKPEELANNQAHNQFFMLPLILGLVGLFFHYGRHPKDFVVVFMLFILTGVALVVYLNSPPVEPRERDYIYAGSYYAFAIWIGMGTMALSYWLSKKLKGLLAPALAIAISLPVPLIMAAEGWDDHDRSNRYFSVDSARNFLASCAPNAILFTGGDNDTFPLWYIQEVEGYRTDVRVIVLSYFNTDWYIDQMTRQAHESAPLPFSLRPEQYRQGGPNDYLPFYESPAVKGAINIRSFMQLVREDHPAIQLKTRFGYYNSIPSREMFLTVDTASVLSRGLIPETLKPNLTSRMDFALRRSGMEKNTLMILDLIDQANWERPIYFNNTSLQGISVDLTPYVVQEGNAYRLLPVRNPEIRNEQVNTDVMYKNVMTEFRYRGLNDPTVYNSIEHRNFALNHRSTFNSLASALLAEGKPEQAREVVLKNLEAITDAAVPYDYSTSQTVSLLFELGEREKALEIGRTLARRANEVLDYIHNYNASLGDERERRLKILFDMGQIMKRENENELASQLEEQFMTQYSRSGMRP